MSPLLVRGCLDCGQEIRSSRHTRCIDCRRVQYRAWKLAREEGIINLRNILVPTEPLRIYLRARRGKSPAQIFGAGSNYERYSWRPRVTMDTADKMAVSLGVHPYEIWGWEWFSYGEDG